ncbi:MAG TPA: CDP-alcohol phosphatidyltransferase family protein, partial [Acidiferrobacteraceae bacterium]|nr:CDP-alcohol phosphatidyltransferase family protein [Acidiferrobacteraceae bacterium]
MDALIIANDPRFLEEICGLTIIDRLLRSLHCSGIKQAIIITSTPGPYHRVVKRRAWPRKQLKISIVELSHPEQMKTWVSILEQHCTDVSNTNGSDPVLIVPHPGIYDTRLIRNLAQGTSPTALVDSQPPDYLNVLPDPQYLSAQGILCGPVCVDRAWLTLQTGSFLSFIQSGLFNEQVKALDVSEQTTYLDSQRRELRPYWFPALDPKLRQVATETILDASKKESMDFPALLHAPIEIFLIQHLCKLPISPNQITIFCNIVAYTATFLFSQGLLAWGIMVALAVGIIDGLDGKQARVKLEVTPVGEYEHTFDYLYELSWWFSLAY